MLSDRNSSFEAEEEGGSLVALAGLSLLVGALAGTVTALFRFLLIKVDGLRNELIGQAQTSNLIGLACVVAGCAVAAGLAAWLVQRFAPQASGSGIPHVEAVINAELPQAPFRLIGIKFVGGIVAIGSGLALGREGPSVQMGSSLAHLIGRVFRRGWADCRVLLAAGAGAGLATAFNAPIAGAIFVLEELVRRFEPRIAIIALGTSAVAISFSRLVLGDSPDFHIGAIGYGDAGIRPFYFVFGAVAGLVAVLYNRLLLGTMAAMERVPLRGWARAALVGACVGALAFYAPRIVGGGDVLTQSALLGTESLALLPLLFVVRLVLGAVSYAVKTPGGLFAPMMVLGAQLGLFCGLATQAMMPTLDVQPQGLALVGMAAFFAGVVRAPLTGLILVIEMTGNFTMLLPMLCACFVAMLVPTLLDNEPIYDSLRQNTLKQARKVR